MLLVLPSTLYYFLKIDLNHLPTYEIVTWALIESANVIILYDRKSESSCLSGPTESLLVIVGCIFHQNSFQYRVIYFHDHYSLFFLIYLLYILFHFLANSISGTGFAVGTNGSVPFLRWPSIFEKWWPAFAERPWVSDG